MCNGKFFLTQFDCWVFEQQTRKNLEDLNKNHGGRRYRQSSLGFINKTRTRSTNWTYRAMMHFFSEYTVCISVKIENIDTTSEHRYRNTYG